MKSQRRVSLALSAMLTALPIAGCGQMATQPLAAPRPVSAQTVRSSSASQLAATFAVTIGTDSEFRAKQQGSTVVVTGPEDIRMVYDFTRTPETGKIQLQAGSYTTEIDHKPGKQPEWAWTVAKIAIRMVYGGVKAYYKYTKAHQAPYDKKELATAIVYGMLQQGVGGLPGGFIWKRLFPIVWKWLIGEPPVSRGTFKATYERWSQDLNEIEAILREAQLQPASAR